jgi:hypothetical protein
MSIKHRRPRLIGKAPAVIGFQKPDNEELAQRIARAIKREAIAKGMIPDPKTRPPNFKFLWSYGSLNGVVYADNRSDARSLIKSDLGVSRKHRLPIEVVIRREPNND